MHLESMQTPVVLIMGGVDKGNDYSMLFDMVKEKVKAIVMPWCRQQEIKKAFSSMVEQSLKQVQRKKRECCKQNCKIRRYSFIVPCNAQVSTY